MSGKSIDFSAAFAEARLMTGARFHQHNHAQEGQNHAQPHFQFASHDLKN